MKINELKRIAEENEYELTKDDIHYKLTRQDFDNNITINNLSKNRLCISIPFVCDKRDFNVIKAAVEFAETPLEDREEEKKFYMEHKYFKCINGDSRYFQIYEPNGNPWLNAMDSIMGYKKQFTLKEIEEIKERFNTDLADFELVEVEE